MRAGFPRGAPDPRSGRGLEAWIKRFAAPERASAGVAHRRRHRVARRRGARTQAPCLPACAHRRRGSSQTRPMTVYSNANVSARANEEPEFHGGLAERAAVLRGALSVNTERALRADLRVFESWCRDRGIAPLPAGADTVAAFVEHMGQRRAPATVRRYVASISLVHRALECADAATSAAAKRAVQRMHRRRGRRQRQAHGLTWSLRQRLVGAAGERLIDARNRALVAVAYDGLLRRSELAALAVGDLAAEVDGAATLLVRRSKSDGEGRGEVVFVARDSVGLLQSWLHGAGIQGGALFRSVRKDGAVGRSLDPSQVPRIFRAMARKAGLPEEVVRGLSGHSPRVGAVQDMIASGIGMPAILQAGRWKSPAMVQRYGERVLAQRNGAAQLARLQGRG